MKQLGAVFWLMAIGLGFLTYTSSRGNQGGELIFAPLAFGALVIALLFTGISRGR